jgi:hypothetical protein
MSGMSVLAVASKMTSHVPSLSGKFICDNVFSAHMRDLLHATLQCSYTALPRNF